MALWAKNSIEETGMIDIGSGAINIDSFVAIKAQDGVDGIGAIPCVKVYFSESTEPLMVTFDTYAQAEKWASTTRERIKSALSARYNKE